MKNLQELVGVQSVVEVVCHPSLQAAEAIGAQRAAAIDETFIEARHFGDVGVRRNEIAIRKLEANFCRWMSSEHGLNFREFHRADS
jgi:hypothetical protein